MTTEQSCLDVLLHEMVGSANDCEQDLKVLQTSLITVECGSVDEKAGCSDAQVLHNQFMRRHLSLRREQMQVLVDVGSTDRLHERRVDIV